MRLYAIILFIIIIPLQAKANIMFEDFSVSPTGNLVAFEFANHPNGARGIGLYDWRNHVLTRIPNPKNSTLSMPSFSRDGVKLVVVLNSKNDDFYASDIAVIDLSNLNITNITQEKYSAVLHNKSYPIFRSKDDILYVNSEIGRRSGLNDVNLTNKRDTAIVSREKGFSTIFHPFIMNGTIYFSAIAPSDSEVIKQVEALNISPVSTIAYRLAPDNRSEIAFPKSEMQHSVKRGFYHEGLNSIQGSWLGNTIVFLYFTEQTPSEHYASDIFKISEDGDFNRLTNLKAHISMIAVSDDGLTIAFGIDEEWQGQFDLAILDVVRKNVIRTDLLALIAQDPKFSLP